MTGNKTTVASFFGTPILYVFTTFALLLVLIFIYKAKAAQIYGRLDDAVNVSCQSVCIPDRYVPGAYHWNREDVVFSTENRTRSEYYIDAPEKATEYAAELAYRRLEELLDYNFPPMVTGYSIERFSLVNMISGNAYQYDVLGGTSAVYGTAELESYLEIKVVVTLELPAFGTTIWTKEDKVILREE